MTPHGRSAWLIEDIGKIFELEILKWSVRMKPSYVEVVVFMTAASNRNQERLQDAKRSKC